MSDISNEYWDRVRELAVEIVHFSAIDDDVLYSTKTNELLEYLQELEGILGKHPSISATKADYLDDPAEREKLYLEAYEMAIRDNDYKNVRLIASSLIDLYFESSRDRSLISEWVKILKNALRFSPDEDDQKSLEEWENSLR